MNQSCFVVHGDELVLYSYFPTKLLPYSAWWRPETRYGSSKWQHLERDYRGLTCITSYLYVAHQSVLYIPEQTNFWCTNVSSFCAANLEIWTILTPSIPPGHSLSWVAQCCTSLNDNQESIEVDCFRPCIVTMQRTTVRKPCDQINVINRVYLAF